MNIGAAFPSAYVKAAEIPSGRMVRVTIESVSVEDVGGKGKAEDKKPVLYFVGTEKGLVLNKTNANAIADTYGTETDEWIGKRIELFSTKVEYQGKMVPAVRVNVPAAAPANGRAAAPAPARRQPEPEPASIGDDSDPFNSEPPSFENTPDDGIPF